MENNCLFCKISSKIISSFDIYENNAVFAFLDINPISPGHTLVIPKIHAENLFDLTDEQISLLFKAVRDVALLLKKRLNPEGFTIGINHGRISGQAVEHIHIHIIPRFENDGGGSLHSVVQNSPKETLKEIQNKIIN